MSDRRPVRLRARQDLAYQSAVHSVGPTGGRNIWLPMPFMARAKMTFTNEGEKTIPFFYQIGYTLGDRHRRTSAGCTCFSPRESDH